MAGIDRLGQQLISEFTTEIATAEIAAWGLGVSVALLAVSLIAPWWLRRKADPLASSLSFPVLRCAALLAGFLILTAQVSQAGWLTGADRPVWSWFQAHRAPAWTSLAVGVSTVGAPTGTAVIAAAAAVVLTWRSRSLIPAAVLGGTLAAADTANILVKFAVGRPRPPIAAQLLTAAHSSYPSGHVAASVALSGGLLLMYDLSGPTRRGGAVARAGVGAAAVVAVGASRLYLGVHWLSDAVGGALLGTTVVLGVAAVLATERGGTRPHRLDRSARDTGCESAAASGPAAEHASSSARAGRTALPRRASARRTVALAAVAVMALSALAAACSARHARPPSQTPASESNTGGDIPDNQAFVAFAAPDGTFELSIPEGWARATNRGATVFTDELNTIGIQSTPRPAAPTPASFQTAELPALAASTAGFRLTGTRTVHHHAGPALLISYIADSPPDPVTGKTRTDEVQRHEFWHNGTEVVLTLSSPEGADNADAWRRVADSLRWR